MEYENNQNQPETENRQTQETPQSPYANGPYATYWQQTPRYTPPQKPKKVKKGWTGGKVIALALCCALLGGICGASVLYVINGIAGKLPEHKPQSSGTVVQEGERANSRVEAITVPTGEKMTAAQVYANNVNSTVGITTVITTNYWGYQTQNSASGSGFIISADGYILTNYHVIQDSSSVTVTTYQGQKYSADVVGYDESNDIAVLKIDAEGLTPVIIGDSSNMNVGDDVLAIGNPLGELTFSLTAGVISSMRREVTLSSGITMDLIQTDCAINSGNSGGALFNYYGEVVGITNAKYSSGGGSASIDNIGFAIPINDVKDIFQSIVEKGYISKPYIGVTVSDVSSDALQLGLPKGAVIRSVVEDGPAAKAGLQVNDIVTHCNGEEVTGSNDLIRKIGEMAPDTEAKLNVYRQGETLEITVTVGEKVTSALQEQNEQQQQQQQQQQQGGQGWFPWNFNFGY